MSLFDNDDNVIGPAPSATPTTPAESMDGVEGHDTAVEESSLGSTTMMDETPSPDSAVSMASPTPTSSKSPPPPPQRGGPSKKKKKVPLPVQLISELPIARDEALSTFTEMEENWYQSQKMGLSRETLESMQCDCVFKPGASPSPAGHCRA